MTAENCEAVTYKNGPSYWIAHVVVYLIVAAASLRVVNGLVVIRKNSAELSSAVMGMQAISLCVVAFAAGCSLLQMIFNIFDTTNAVHYLFFSFDFATFLFYDVWLLLRDRALQCFYFQTPRSWLRVVWGLVVLAFIAAVVLLAQPKEFLIFTPVAVALYAAQILIQVFIAIIMAFLFVRPFLMRTEEVGTSQVIVDVVRRTALGATLHLVTSLLYIALLVLNQIGILCVVSKGIFFSLSILGLVIHLSISHRDDLPLRRAGSLVCLQVKRLLPPHCWFRISEPNRVGGTPKGGLFAYIALLEKEERSSVLVTKMVTTGAIEVKIQKREGGERIGDVEVVRSTGTAV